MGDHRSISILPSIYQSTILGTSRAASWHRQRRALPDTAGDQLERPGADFLARAAHTDDRRFRPSPMAALERLTHRGRCRCIRTMIRTTIGQVHQVADKIALDSLRIDEMGHAEAFSILARPG